MTTTINNSYSAIVPAVYGTATPVIDVGRGAGSVNAVVALTRAGSVVVNLGSAPPGAVTYTASGLVHEMSSSSVPVSESTHASAPTAAEKSAEVAADAASEPQMLGQGIEAAYSQPAPIMVGAGDGVYDGSGMFTPSAGISVISLDSFQVLGGGGAAAGGGDSAGPGSSGAVGSLVSTSV